MRVAPEIVLTSAERAELMRLVLSKRTSVRLEQRAGMILLAADGLQNKDIAEILGTGRIQVARWRERYAQGRLAGIERDLPRGAPPVKVDVPRLVELTTQSKPEAATHWSTRTMAAELGVSAASVSRHWRANGLKPHLVRGFKISRDPKFVEKLEDIVGLYLSPPEHAMVLCCDEKSQVQALDRTQPGLPLTKGRAATMTHDYKRNGTTTLFAALVLDGQVIAQCQQRHRHTEWLKFLRKIDRHTPTSKTQNRLRRGVFTNVPELITAIEEYIAHHNTKPKPFIWTKSAADILQKVIRANNRLSSKQNATLHEFLSGCLLDLTTLSLIEDSVSDEQTRDLLPSSTWRPHTSTIAEQSLGSLYRWLRLCAGSSAIIVVQSLPDPKAKSRFAK